MNHLYKSYPNSVLLETNLLQTEENRNFYFQNPIEILEAYTLSESESILKKIETYIDMDLYLAGFISYETGYLFEDKFRREYADRKFSFPLIWFGVYENPIIETINKEEIINSQARNNFSISSLSVNLSEEEYIKKVNKILRYIYDGETYQVNFTFNSDFIFEGDVFSFYESLKSQQKVSYSAKIEFQDSHILSLSPELFFKIKDNQIITKPMKGTMKRGKSLLDDALLENQLKTDVKNIAENSMIVDLIRNDLGKISRIGSVKVENLLQIEKFQTLFQMTSTVKSILNEKVSYYELFKALFPGGSITGAPKYRTMQIIQELETKQRGVYTGAIGFISKKESMFNIPIRTILINKNKCSMGIGSGIVWDSKPEKEYEESLLKQKFLLNALSFNLFESILFKNRNFILLDLHLTRLEDSSKFFGFQFEKQEILHNLNFFKLEREKLKDDRRLKVKLTLSRDGLIKIEHSEISRMNKQKGIISISEVKINSKNIFQMHKTSNRRIYANAYQKANENGKIDFLFLNEKEEAVETSIFNIFIKKGNKYYTPPVSSGALAGVMREYLIRKGVLKEKTLKIPDLHLAENIYLCNSVRGIMRVNLH